MQDLIQNSYWWFGINNVKKRTPTSKCHVIYPDIAPMLNGLRQEFEWPYHKPSKRFYELMRPGDKVLFWMGDGSYLNWGILGFGYISEIKRSAQPISNRYVLKANYIPLVPLSPYPSKQPQETETVKFLRQTFGVGFRPLGKTFKNVGYEKHKWTIITIDEMTREQYEAVQSYTRVHSGEPELGLDSVESSIEYSFIGDTEARFLEEILDVPQLDETVKKSLQDTRVGQERFRSSLIKLWNGCCAVTRFEDERVLRASHIKPWHDCDNTKRLDPFNGLLLVPNLDVAFDKGLITFDEQGMIVISSSFRDKARLLGITDDMKIRVHQRHQRYLVYHRENIFVK